ncbi:MAG: CDP-diacylglycerol--serine O-phosphatidyltransferase [bacterium]
MDIRKGKIILPSTFTSFSLVLGFLAIISCFAENLPFNVFAACWMVVFATILDGMDGKVARLTKTTSDFGIEYDSMADLVTFGIAPAVILYKVFLMELDPVFLVFPILFLLSAAIRLARFNTTASQKTKLFNVGLPMPVAGGMLCTSILFLNFLKNQGYVLGTEKQILPIILGLTIYICCHMISTIKYDTLFDFWFKSNPFVLLRYGIITFFIFILVFVDPAVFFFGIAAYYILYGSLRHFYYRIYSGHVQVPPITEKQEQQSV